MRGNLWRALARLAASVTLAGTALGMAPRLTQAAGPISITNCPSFSTLQSDLQGGGSYLYTGPSACTVAFTDTIDIAGGTSASLDAHGATLIFDGGSTVELFSVFGSGVNGPSSLTLSNSGHGGGITIQNGSSPDIGGGLDAEGTVNLTDVTFKNNTAVDAGGGLFNGGTLNLTSVSFLGNTVTGAGSEGGGLLNAGTLILTSAFFSNNSAAGDGGGLYNDGPATLTNAAFTGNSAQGQRGLIGFGGGGIYNEGTLTLANATLSANTVSNATKPVKGGGLYNLTESTATLVNVTVSGNSATATGAEGGGIYSNGALILTNDTVSNNDSSGAASDGGGISNGRPSGSGTVRLANTIIAGNTVGGVAGTDTNCSLPGATITDSGGNLELPAGTPPTDCGLGATNNVLGQDPALGPLTDNGGILVGAPGATSPLLTRAIAETSPAFDLGIDDTCTNSLAGTPPGPSDLDERGLPRNAETREACDSGAYDTGDDVNTPPSSIAGAVNGLSGPAIRLGFAGSNVPSFPLGYITLQDGTSSLIVRQPVLLDCPDQCAGTTAIPALGTATLTLSGVVGGGSVKGSLFAAGDTVKVIVTLVSARITPTSTTITHTAIRVEVQVFAPGSLTPFLDLTQSAPLGQQSKVTFATA